MKLNKLTEAEWEDLKAWALICAIAALIVILVQVLA